MRHDTHRPGALRRVLAVTASISLAASCVSAGTLAASGALPHALFAHGARVISLNEYGNLHLTSKHGFTLNEKGVASGTVKGAIYVHLNIVSSNRVTAEMNIYPRGGSLTASGSAGYRKESTLARFSGAMSIDRGSGSFAHAHGSNLSFSGTIQRSTDAVTVHVTGRAFD